MTREAWYCLDYVRMLRARGIGIFFEEQNIDTLKNDSELYLVIYAGFAQSESESISHRSRMPLLRRADKLFDRDCADSLFEVFIVELITENGNQLCNAIEDVGRKRVHISFPRTNTKTEHTTQSMKGGSDTNENDTSRETEQAGTAEISCG